VRVALVTCRPDPLYDDELEGVDTHLQAALTERGVEVETPWWRDEAVDWAAFDVVVVRTTWDYLEDRDAFVAWAAATGAVTSVWNPPDVLRWNTHKAYLLELEERGAPVVPTAWLGAGDAVDLGALLALRDWGRAVVKPAVGGGSEGLARVAAQPRDGFLDVPAGQRHLDELLATGDVLVQPYLDRIEVDGEVSVVVVDGEPVFAVRKRPRSGDYRIQLHHGGSYERAELDAELASLARWIVEATGTELLAARVDLVPSDDGTWQLAELEATEPDLYLRVVPEGAGPLADAIVRRARRPVGR
jgi:glutathione synthase/RimK-type ligase-like ATP-grasp enzyme